MSKVMQSSAQLHTPRNTGKMLFSIRIPRIKHRNHLLLQISLLAPLTHPHHNGGIAGNSPEASQVSVVEDKGGGQSMAQGPAHPTG